jgi:hypothetical protein
MELGKCEEAWTVKQETVVQSLKKCGVCYTLDDDDDDDDDVLFEESESSNHNESDDKYGSK